jgi:hypothetical protein
VATAPRPWIIALLYLPATAMALLRPEPDGSAAPARRVLARVGGRLRARLGRRSMLVETDRV